MNEYQQFLKFLNEQEPDSWVDLSKISDSFPDLKRSTVDRLVSSNRLELRDNTENGHQVRLTEKGKAYVNKNIKPKKVGVIATILFIIFYVLLRLFRQ